MTDWDSTRCVLQYIALLALAIGTPQLLFGLDAGLLVHAPAAASFSGVRGVAASEMQRLQAAAAVCTAPAMSPVAAAGEALDWADDWMRQLVACVAEHRTVHLDRGVSIENAACVGESHTCSLPLVVMRDASEVKHSRFEPQGTRRRIPRVFFRALWPDILSRDAPRNSSITRGFFDSIKANRDADHLIWSLSMMEKFMNRVDIPNVITPSVRHAWRALKSPIAARCDLFRAALLAQYGVRAHAVFSLSLSLSLSLPSFSLPLPLSLSLSNSLPHSSLPLSVSSHLHTGRVGRFRRGGERFHVSTDRRGRSSHRCSRIYATLHELDLTRAVANGLLSRPPVRAALYALGFG